MEKEKANNNYIELIKNSWTFKKLTEKEKQNFFDVLFDNRIKNIIKGNYSQRCAILNAIYFSFLKALEYEPINWRKENWEGEK